MAYQLMNQFMFQCRSQRSVHGAEQQSGRDKFQSLQKFMFAVTAESEPEAAPVPPLTCTAVTPINVQPA